MGTKLNPGDYDCYSMAEDDEPIFVLRGNHPLSPGMVETWAARYADLKVIENGGKPMDDRQKAKFDDALRVAGHMRAWKASRRG